MLAGGSLRGGGLEGRCGGVGGVLCMTDLLTCAHDPSGFLVGLKKLALGSPTMAEYSIVQ